MVDAPAWCRPYIGLEFEEHGRGPRYDCWGYFRMVQERQFGLALPSFAAAYASVKDYKRSVGILSGIITTNMEDWVLVDRPIGGVINTEDHQPGDGILFRLRGQPLHVGVIAGPGVVLHIDSGHDSVIESYDSLKWRNRIVGIHRYVASGSNPAPVL